MINALFFYGFDWTYLILVLPSFLISLLTSLTVKRRFAEYSQVSSCRCIEAQAAVHDILNANGIFDVRIHKIPGELTDHYSPTNNTIGLSDKVYASTSIAAIGIACHEAGHAIQYAKNYFPIKVRAAIIPVTNFGAKLALPLILIGFLLSYLVTFSYVFVYLGIACFSLSLLFQLITLPVEFNASRRAMQEIRKRNLLTPSECTSVKKILSAAAMTYVAALAVSLAQLARLILLFTGRRNFRRN